MSLKLVVKASPITYLSFIYIYECSNFPLKNVSVDCAHCLGLQFIVCYNHNVKSVWHFGASFPVCTEIVPAVPVNNLRE